MKNIMLILWMFVLANEAFAKKETVFISSCGKPEVKKEVCIATQATENRKLDYFILTRRPESSKGTLLPVKRKDLSRGVGVAHERYTGKVVAENGTTLNITLETRKISNPYSKKNIATYTIKDTRYYQTWEKSFVMYKENREIDLIVN